MDAWIAPFLAEYRRTGVLAKAARTAGVGYSTVSARRQSDADFAAACDDALEEFMDSVEAEAFERAVRGTPEPLTYQGAISYEVERDEQGRPVFEQYDTGVLDKDGNPVIASRPKLKLDAQGRPVPVVVHKKSDALLIAVLKGRRKRVYSDRTELTGADGGPVKLDDTARAARVAQLMALARQRREQAKQAEDFGDIA